MGQTLRSWKPKRLVILSTRVQTWRYPNFTHAQLSTSTEARGLLHSENGSTPWQKNCRICTGFDQMFDIRSKYVSDLWPNDFRWNQESKQKWVVCIISLCVYVNVRIYIYIYIYIYYRKKYTNIWRIAKVRRFMIIHFIRPQTSPLLVCQVDITWTYAHWPIAKPSWPKAQSRSWRASVTGCPTPKQTVEVFSASKEWCTQSITTLIVINCG